MTAKLDYGIFDCDTHCYETRDAFTRYLPKEFHDRAIAPVRGADGKEVILAGHRIATFNSEAGLGFDLAYRPGSLKEMLKQMGSGNPDETYEPQPMQPEFLEREPRLKVMAQQNVERAVIFPAGMALAAEHYVDDTEALYANLRSFNRWFDETWGFNYQDKIYATALLSLRDLDSSIAETEAIIEQGARLVLLPTGPGLRPLARRSVLRPDLGAAAGSRLHVGVPYPCRYWYFDAISPAWGHNPDPAAWHMSAWQWMNVYGQRPIEDTLSALIFDNLFGRFPDLKVLVAEHGAEWVPHFVIHMDKSRGMGRNGPWIGGKLTERPSQIFRRHVGVVPYPEDDIPTIVDRLGYDDCLLMGSDYPHAEGLAEPADFVKLLDPLDDAAKKRIMRDNADQLLPRG